MLYVSCPNVSDPRTTSDQWHESMQGCHLEMGRWGGEGQYLWGKTVPGGTLIGKQKLWETLLQTHAMLPVKSWLWETENVLIMLVMLMKAAKNASFSVSWKVMFKVKWMVNFISFQDILLHLLVLNCWTSPHFKMHLQHWSSYCALITNLKVKLY